MQHTAPFLRFVVAGSLSRDFIILPSGKTVIDQAGGSLLYAAAGLRLWNEPIGLLGRINEDYPRDWFAKFESHGFDVRGIQVDTEYQDQRRFIAYQNMEQPDCTNPMAHFARIGMAFPKSLLGYNPANARPGTRFIDDRTLKLREIPADYIDATAMHICAMDSASQSRLPSFFRQGQVTTISMMASDEYMDPIYWDQIPVILKGITAFICKEDQVRNLFKGRTSDLWEMAEALAAFDCEFVIIEQKYYRYLIFDSVSKTRVEVPTYPVQIIDPTGVSDAFCGGFIAGLREFQEPIMAAMKGSISASFTLEGSGPFYCLEALPALVNARFEAVRNMVIRL